MNVMENKTMSDPIYLVGSCEDNFIVDRVFLSEQEAISYCDKQVCKKYAWAVVSLLPGQPWWDNVNVHRTERIKQGA